MDKKGVINFLKPPGMTSHDAVSLIRRTYGIKRVGHAGTLDPAAAGVLPLAVGRATRLLEYMTDCDKSYRAEITFGYATDTGDDTGSVIASQPCKLPETSVIEKAVLSFKGHISQVPPAYSAIKIGGKKMYELARAGIEFERQPRSVTIHEIKLLHRDDSTIFIDVTCSKGTYIRSLCVDIGQKLGCLAVMSFLVRTRVGTFCLEDAFSVEEIIENPARVLLEPDTALCHIPKVVLSQDQAQAFKNGRAIPYSTTQSGLVRVYNENSKLLGIAKYSFESALLTAIKVLSGSEQ